MATSCFNCTHGRMAPCAWHRISAAADDVRAAFPDAKSSGNWHVEPFAMTRAEVDFAKLRGRISGRAIETYDLVPGRYVRLVRGSRDVGAFGRTIVMSTTPMELRTQEEALLCARGHVLVGGLGLGVVARALRALPTVTRVTVVELSEDVIGLVGPTLPQGIDIVSGDVASWSPPRGTSYGLVWLDIWSDVPNRDDWPLMKRLRRRWRRWAPAAGAVRCWREWDAREGR